MKGTVHYEIEFKGTQRARWQSLRSLFGGILAFVDEEAAARRIEALSGVSKARVVRVTREPQRAVTP